MAGPPGLGDIVREMQERVGFLLSADKQAAEAIEILRDTHRILGKLEATVDRFQTTADDLQERAQDIDISAKRIDRLEEAVLNIERATLSVEAVMHALPKSVQQRIQRELKQHRQS